MRKIILLFLISIFGCSSESNDIESIEIMSYYYNLNENQTEFKTEIVNYSVIDENGNVETIQKTPSLKTPFIFFRSTIEKKIIDEISLNNKIKNERYYKENSRINPLIEIDCGPINRIKIKYKNQKELTFNYSRYKTDLKYKEFLQLQNLINTNYLEKRFYKIKNTNQLEKSCKYFQEYSLNKDTLELSFPPMPLPSKKNIKFVK